MKQPPLAGYRGEAENTGYERHSFTLGSCKGDMLRDTNQLPGVSLLLVAGGKWIVISDRPATEAWDLHSSPKLTFYQQCQCHPLEIMEIILFDLELFFLILWKCGQKHLVHFINLKHGIYVRIFQLDIQTQTSLPSRLYPQASLLGKFWNPHCCPAHLWPHPWPRHWRRAEGFIPLVTRNPVLLLTCWVEIASLAFDFMTTIFPLVRIYFAVSAALVWFWDFGGNFMTLLNNQKCRVTWSVSL